MTFLPRSLLWRTVVVVGTTVVVGQFVWLEIVDSYQNRQGAQIAILQTVSMVEIQQHALEVMPESARPGYMRRLEQQRHIHFEPVTPGVLPGEEPETPTLKAIAEQLRTSLGPQVEVRVEFPDPHLIAGHPTPNDPGPETPASPPKPQGSEAGSSPVAEVSATAAGPALGPNAMADRATLEPCCRPLQVAAGGSKFRSDNSSTGW